MLSMALGIKVKSPPRLPVFLDLFPYTPVQFPSSPAYSGASELALLSWQGCPSFKTLLSPSPVLPALRVHSSHLQHFTTMRPDLGGGFGVTGHLFCCCSPGTPNRAHKGANVCDRVNQQAMTGLRAHSDIMASR